MFGTSDRSRRRLTAGVAITTVAGLLAGHPELSTADSFVLSWFSPGDRQNDGGHVRLGTVHW